MKIVPNNKFLYKCNLTNTSLCDFCSMNIESNKHLFWECPISRSLWTELEMFLINKQIHTKLDYEIISLGYTEQSSYSILLNCIFVYAKYYIFKCKYESTIPTFNSFKMYLRYHESIEKIIAMTKNKLPNHVKKWTQLQL